MNRYTIYCTEEQTKKALELGAPIRKRTIDDKTHLIAITHRDFLTTYVLPTAEQMRRWLQEQGFMFVIFERPKIAHSFYVYYRYWDTLVKEDDGFATDEEVTLAVIDAALDYLIKNKK